MSKSANLLPAGFEALEPFAADWAVPGMARRAQRRDESTPEERAAFYQSANGLVAKALDYLDRKPLREFDERETRLMNLLLSFTHVALAEEIQRDAEAGHARSRVAMRITREPDTA